LLLNHGSCKVVERIISDRLTAAGNRWLLRSEYRSGVQLCWLERESWLLKRGLLRWEPMLLLLLLLVWRVVCVVRHLKV
jgi:hypothetical protein